MTSLNIPTPKSTRSTTKRYIQPAIKLDRPVLKELNKNDYLTFKLRTNPTDSESTTYELSVAYFDHGTPEELLKFLESLEKVIKGQNITGGPNRYTLARRLFKGDALAAFEGAAAETGTETQDHYETVIAAVIKHVFPQKALPTQKRHMRRFLRKPREMSIRAFCARLTEINKYLESFPPAGDGAKQLEQDELLDIAEFAVPATWQKTMVMHGFDPTMHTMQEFVEFCERLEYAEGFEPNTGNTGAKSQKESKNPKDGPFHAKSSEKGNNKKRKSSDKWCIYHQTDSHDTGDCKVMQSQAKKMRSNWEANKGTSTSTSKNKTWNRNNQGSNDKTAKENFSLKKLLRKELQELLNQEKEQEKKNEEETFNLEDFQNFNISDDDSS